MSKPSDALAKNKRAPLFSLDTWAVTLAIALSVLVWIGFIKHVPW